MGRRNHVARCWAHVGGVARCGAGTGAGAAPSILVPAGDCGGRGRPRLAPKVEGARRKAREPDTSTHEALSAPARCIPRRIKLAALAARKPAMRAIHILGGTMLRMRNALVSMG